MVYLFLFYGLCWDLGLWIMGCSLFYQLYMEFGLVSILVCF